MPRALKWTADMDDLIRERRAEGATWDGIAAELGHARWTTIERAKLIGAHSVRAGARAPAEAARDRDALPPGDPITWGAITRGTILDGEPYAYRAPVVVGKEEGPDAAPERWEDAA